MQLSTVVPWLPTALLQQFCGGGNRFTTRSFIALAAVFLVGNVSVLLKGTVFSQGDEVLLGTTRKLVGVPRAVKALHAITPELIAFSYD